MQGTQLSGEAQSFQEILLQIDILLNQFINLYSSELIKFGNNIKILFLQTAKNQQLKNNLKGQLPSTVKQIENTLNYSIDIAKHQMNLTIQYWKTQVHWENIQKKQDQQKRRDDRNRSAQDKGTKEIPKLEIPKLDLKCPLCTITFSSVDNVFKHMKDVHELVQFDCNFHCLECDYKNEKLKEFIDVHLFKFHGKYDENNERYYLDPQTGQKYYSKQNKRLRKQIFNSIRFTKINEQFELLMKVATQVRGNNNVYSQKKIKNQNNEYIRGRSKIIVTPDGYLCPVCQDNDSKSLKQLGTHIKNVHKSSYPNHLFCPHCLLNSTNRLTLAEHLLMKHRQKENFTDGFYQVVGTGEKVYIQKRLAKIVLEEEAYHTFFNPDAPEVE